MTFALTIGFSCVAGLIVAVFDLGAVAAACLCFVVIALVKVISKRPEFDGLPAPPPS